WMMDNGDKQLFTKKFTINMPDEVNVVLGFRKSGEPIIEMIRDHIVLEDLFVYEPYSGHINCFGITVIEDSCDGFIGIVGVEEWKRCGAYVEALEMLGKPITLVFSERVVDESETEEDASNE
ncbi:hypothetical protein Tco_0993015, partial [Tanacetum coccineum]